MLRSVATGKCWSQPIYENSQTLFNNFRLKCYTQAGPSVVGASGVVTADLTEAFPAQPALERSGGDAGTSSSPVKKSIIIFSLYIHLLISTPLPHRRRFSYFLLSSLFAICLYIHLSASPIFYLLVYLSINLCV